MEWTVAHTQICQGAPGSPRYQRSPKHITNMDNYLALLFLCLLHMLNTGRASPLSRDPVNTRAKVKLTAEQLMKKIDIYLEHLPASLVISPPADSLDGLSSVVLVLEGYNSLLSETLEDLPQMKAELSSLWGLLMDDWRTERCDRGPKPLLQGRLAELRRRKIYIHTVGIEALMGLKEYLNRLLKNLDLLGSC